MFVSSRKKGGVKKKSSENLPFCVFFLKNDQILTNTKIFKIRFFFSSKRTNKSTTSFQTHFKSFWGEISISGYYFGIFTALVENNYFLRQIEIFFSRDLLLFLIKIIFLFFCFFGKICHFMKEKKTFWPLLSSLSYLPIFLQKW